MAQTKFKPTSTPQLPVDTYTPNFNITEFINLCKQDNVKYVFTYEYGGTVPYFNTTLDLMQIYTQMYASGNFSANLTSSNLRRRPTKNFHRKLHRLRPLNYIEFLSEKIALDYIAIYF